MAARALSWHTISMQSEALPSVQFPLSSYFGTVAPGQFLPIVVAIAFGLWAVYTLVAAYHWLRYGRSSVVAIPALAVHVFVSASIAAYALSGFH